MTQLSVSIGIFVHRSKTRGITDAKKMATATILDC